MSPPPPRSTLFPYTTLFRSLRKRFAKLRGRATDNSLKFAIEVRHGLKSACEGSFADSRVGIEQKRLRFLDRKSTRLNSSHMSISYAVFCLKKKKKCKTQQ